MCSEFSAINSVVMSSPGGLVKVPINEPAAGLKKSQIEEFVTFYSGNSVQHIAFLTNDICAAVLNLKQRSMQFITVPDNYYDTLRKRLAQTEKLHINKDLEQIKELRILVDFDKGSYLLQTFTKPLPERMCSILVGSSGFVSSDKRAIRNEEWDRGSRIEASYSSNSAS